MARTWSSVTSASKSCPDQRSGCKWISLPSRSNSVTSAIVSGYYQLPDGSQHGLLYNSNTKAYSFLDDPNAATSGLSITQITGINNSGEIAGFYVDAATGLQRGFVATAAPEPGTFGMLLTLLLPVLAVRWSRLRAAHRPQPSEGCGGNES
jgi:hypothetical protein